MTFNIPDFINGIFEGGIGIFQWVNVSVIRKDQDVRGVHWSLTAWTSLWGVYNLYYYPHLNQWLSFTGGCIIVTANIIWLAHALQYKGVIPWQLPLVRPVSSQSSTGTFLTDPFTKRAV